jgi:hypothetical protein
MKALKIVRTLVLLAPLAACVHHPLASIDILPVPPQDSRWERDKPQHLHLPLTAPDRTELVKSLRYGLSHDNEADNRAVDPNPESTYGKLLDLLAKPAALADLSKPEFTTWFVGDRVNQVIDAREEALTNDHAPVALRGVPSGGVYWWIFYRDGSDHLNQVMLVKLQALTKLIERKK